MNMFGNPGSVAVLSFANTSETQSDHTWPLPTTHTLHAICICHPEQTGIEDYNKAQWLCLHYHGVTWATWCFESPAIDGPCLNQQQRSISIVCRHHVQCQLLWLKSPCLFHSKCTCLSFRIRGDLSDFINIIINIILGIIIFYWACWYLLANIQHTDSFNFNLWNSGLLSCNTHLWTMELIRCS